MDYLDCDDSDDYWLYSLAPFLYIEVIMAVTANIKMKTMIPGTVTNSGSFVCR